MHNNKAVLDEAVHSLSRKIIRSVVGTVCVVSGVGALSAANMLGPNAIAATFASWRSDAAQVVERAPVLANESVKRTPIPAPAEKVVPSTQPVARQRTMMASFAPPAEGVLSFVPPSSPYITASAKPAIDVALLSAPLDAGNPSETDSPFEMPKPAEAAKSFEVPAPAEIFRPVEASAPAQALTPFEVTKPVEAARPIEAAKPVEAAAPIEAPAFAEVRVVLPQGADVPLPLPRPPLTPAQQLGLEGADRVKHEKCLAQAVYFEARNEPVRGQVAVAQVVMNRVFSPYYPKDVCSVVYQNAHRLLSCQFTFACDGQPESIRERGAWARAQRIAKQTLDAQLWLPEVAKSTHYHATYVRPNWVREMKVMAKHGLHVFYRPHRWGDGADEPGWVRLSAKR